jgi:serine/threonine protein kinase
MSTPQNRYEVFESLGTGATSRVDKARDTLIGRTVALKTLLRGFGSRDLQQQFLREAQIIGGLSHPNIVGLYDVGTNSDGAPYFVMEYVEGKTLESFFDAGPLPLARVAVWTGDLATALSQAHRAHVIHGDVKPANILVTRDNQVKLGDFGVARFSTQASGSGNVMGTPAYLSPEQILGHLQDSRSDLFSLGIVLYQMATGIRPFNGDSVEAVCAQIISSAPPPPSHHNPSLPSAFDQVVMRCLAKNPDDRFTTAEALASSLYPFARNKQAPPVRSNSAVTQRGNLPWWSRPFRPSDMWAIAAALLLLISGVLAISALHKRSIPSLTASAAMADRGAVMPDRSAAPDSPVSMSASMAAVASPAGADSPVKDPTSASTKQESLLPPESTPSVPKIPRRAKSSTLGKRASALATEPTRNASPAQPPSATPSASAESARPKELASLRIEIVSAIAEETLAVYAGQDVLVSTRLDSAHLGETLHFDCPLAAGTHPLRVVLYRADDSLHLQKEGFAEIVPDGSNTLDIRVNRRSKLLIRKEAALEVSWPVPHSAAAQNASALVSPPKQKISPWASFRSPH